MDHGWFVPAECLVAQRYRASRRTVLASMLAVGAALWTFAAEAQNATWNGGAGNFSTASSWTPNIVPTGTATFDKPGGTVIIVDPVEIGGWSFITGATPYIFEIADVLEFTGAGIDIQAGDAILDISQAVNFLNMSSAGSATIDNGGLLTFADMSTASSADIVNTANLTFSDQSSASNATIDNRNSLVFEIGSGAGNASITNTGTVRFTGSSNADDAVIDNFGTIFFEDTGNATRAIINTMGGAKTVFRDRSNGSLATFSTSAGGTTDFSGSAGFFSDSKLFAGSLDGAGAYFLGANEVTLNSNASTNVSGIISDCGATGTECEAFPPGAAGGSLIKNGIGTLTLSGANTFTGGITGRQGTVRLGSNMAAGTGTITAEGAVIGYADGVTIANLLTINAPTAQLEVLSGSATQSGAITETSGPRALEKIGAGTLNLAAANTFTGPLTVTAGTLGLQNGAAVQDAIDVTVSAGAALNVAASETIGSLAGAGGVSLAAAQTLTTGGNDNATAFSGVIDGAGGLIKTGTGTLTLSGSNTYTGPTAVNDGILVVNGSILSPVTVNAGAVLGGTGQTGALTVGAGGVFAPGNSIGTMVVNGGLTLAAGATYEVEINPSGGGDKAIVNGTVNLTGATLSVLAANGTYTPNSKYTIIQNDDADAVVGTFASVSSNFAFLAPVVDYAGGDGNDVVLTVLRTAVPVTAGGGSGGVTFVSFCSVAVSKNQCRVAEALDQFPMSNPLFLAVLTQTVEGARQAFDALSGEVHATVAGTLSSDSRYVREAVLGRLMQATHEGGVLSASGPQLASYDSQAMMLDGSGMYDGKSLVAMPEHAPLAFWTRAFGAWGDFETDGNAASAEHDLGGFISGMDASIGGSWRAGLATGASFSNVSVDDRYSSANVETYHLGGYLGGMAGLLALRGGGLWAWSEIGTSRAVVFPGFYERQTANYDADTGQLFGEVAYPTQLGGIALEPFGGLAIVSVDTDSFRERGGPEASLRGVNTNQDVAYASVGLRAATAITIGGVQVVPHISAAWLHAFDDVTPGALLAFATTGIGFAVDGVPLAEDSALLDAGIDLALSDRLSVGVSCSGQFADDISDNAVKGRLTWLFN